jgi:tRNA threonylcarbamoyladenosine biosynthesis protein TsaE
MLKIVSSSENTTRNIAEKLAGLLFAGDIICLFGNLGAGKTVFASGLAFGLHIHDNISSPTFTILHEFEGRLPLYHFDVYRINSEEFLDIGGEEYLCGDGISLIEWPENILDTLPAERLEVHINYDDSLSDNIVRREIIFNPLGQKYIEKISTLSDILRNEEIK